MDNKNKSVQIVAVKPNQTVLKTIGNTTYQMNIFFNLNAKETINDKVLRLIKNELMECG
ncbi:MAG: transposon-encoded TnpW family protein [Ruminococcus sp.]|jgi:hypothetical protein|nr:transposon-encoded TnpW family protein [Ruminococcus sp.]